MKWLAGGARRSPLARRYGGRPELLPHDGSARVRRTMALVAALLFGLAALTVAAGWVVWRRAGRRTA